MTSQSSLARRARFGGVDAAELANVYGTPLVVIDTDVLDATIARFERLATRFDIDVAYAAKALFFIALAYRIGGSRLDVDVCSLGELLVAERGGIDPARIVFHGCGKTDDELDAAIDGRVARVVVDHREELAHLQRRAPPARPLDIVLRLNAGIETATHAHVRTSGDDSKFGFHADAIDAAVDAVLASPGLRLVGIHSHLGSQLFDAVALVENVGRLVAVAARASARGAPIARVIAGGGFGVATRPGDEPIDLERTLGALADAFSAECAAHGLAGVRLGIEPGRSLVAEAGTSLYRVLAVKQHGARRFAIVDGSMADNPRPALYGAYHHPEVVARAAGTAPDEPLVETTVCGRSCERDELVVAPLPRNLAPGDLLAMRTTGAYTFSMASNYNRFPRPALVLAGGGAHRIAVRREHAADLLRNDVDAGS